MESLFRYHAPASTCGYLPDEVWRLEYEFVAQISPAEYMQRMLSGWRRFGSALFHPKCPSCSKCQPLRVVVDRFRPNRSQRRAKKANDAVIQRRIGEPSVTRAKLELYDRYHAFQADAKGWPSHDRNNAEMYEESYVHNPLPTQEWCYYLGRRLVGVGYVDVLPQGLSAIYFFYDPEERRRALGVWNVLSILAEANRRRLPHVYLGYYVEGCPSMVYKAGFVPNQIRGPDGRWVDFRS